MINSSSRIHCYDTYADKDAFECIKCVTSKSPMYLRKRVENFARFFRREFNYDFTQYSTSDTYEYEAYLLGSHCLYTNSYVGAAKMQTNTFTSLGKGAQKIWCLEWIWIHPYARNRGIGKAFLQFLTERYKCFIVMPPLSKSMRNLLRYSITSKRFYNFVHNQRR